MGANERNRNIGGGPTGSTQHDRPGNAHLKTVPFNLSGSTLSEDPNDIGYRFVFGVWRQDSGNLAWGRAFPKQASIHREGSKNVCTELKVHLSVEPGKVDIDSADETEYRIEPWDRFGLTARNPFHVCHQPVLKIDFKSGAVSLTDIPTHEKGCGTCATDVYHLEWGFYSIETPENK